MVTVRVESGSRGERWAKIFQMGFQHFFIYFLSFFLVLHFPNFLRKGKIENGKLCFPTKHWLNLPQTSTQNPNFTLMPPNRFPPTWVRGSNVSNFTIVKAEKVSARPLIQIATTFYNFKIMRSSDDLMSYLDLVYYNPKSNNSEYFDSIENT